jgi:hypothetical protein
LLGQFTTGAATEIALTDSGNYNVYENMKIIGIADAAALAGTTARHIKLSGTGTSFNNCTIGSANFTRSVANASIEFSGGATDIQFNNCDLHIKGSAAGVLFVLTVAAGAVGTNVSFNNTLFLNTIPGSTQMTVAYSATAALTGGKLVLNNCTLVGGTKWGDTNGLASTVICSTTSTAATAGLAVAPA